MNWISRLVLILVPFLLLSCGDEDEGSRGFSLILPGQAAIIPTSTSSCNSIFEDDLEKSYFRMRPATILWERANEELILSTLRVDIKSSALDSDYRAVMDSTAISDLFVIQGEGGATAIENGVVPPNSELVLRGNCSLGFGGLTFPEDSRNFTAEAVLTLDGVAVGVQEGEGGNLGVEAPVRAIRRVRLSYSLN